MLKSRPLLSPSVLGLRPRRSKPEVPEPQPNDIITAMGTLIGLIFTAFALISNIAVSQGTFALTSGIEFEVLAFFILTAFFATLASVTNWQYLWEIAKGLYPASWLALVFGIAAVFLILSNPNHPPDIVLLALLVLSIGGVAAVVGISRSKAVSNSFGAIRLEAANAPKATVSARTEMETSSTLRFLSEYIDVERMLRQMGESTKLRTNLPMHQLLAGLSKSGKIKPEDYKLMLSLTQIRNAVVHGIGVPRPDLVAGLEVLAKIREHLG